MSSREHFRSFPRKRESRATISAAALTIPFLLGIWLGGKLFDRLSETGIRRLALFLMLLIGVVSLFL